MLNSIAPRSTTSSHAPWAGGNWSTAQQQACLRLVGQVQQGSVEARRRLIEHCLPLIQRIARGCATRAQAAEEFLSDGAIALLHAARSYNPASGTPFQAYAATWIRHAMRHAARDTRQTIRVSGRVQARLNRVWAAARRIEGATGRRASAAEIARLSGLTATEVHAALERRGASVVSIDQPPAGREFAPPLAGAEQRQDSLADQEQTAAWIHTLLDAMPAAERDLVIRRFGLDEKAPATIRDLSRATGMAPAQVRFALDRALGRLRTLAQT